MIFRKIPSYDFERAEEGGLHTAGSKSRSSLTLSSPARATPTGSLRTHALMFGTYFVAAAIAVAHHFFLYNLNGRDVEEYPLSQTWVRDVGNALAGLAQLLLQTSVTIALTQSIWRYVRRHDVTLNNLDVLFSLPSLTTLPSSLFKSSVLYALFLAGVIQTLSLITIFAPNALSVAPASPANSTLLVPVPSLDRLSSKTTSEFFEDSIPGPGGSADNMKIAYFYNSPSPLFQNLARLVLNSNSILPWSAPPRCGGTCNYDVQYWGPALKCVDIPQSSIGLLPWNSTGLEDVGQGGIFYPNYTDVSDPSYFLGPTYVYNATTAVDIWSEFTSLITPQSTSWRVSDKQPFSFDIVYAANHFNSSGFWDMANLVGHSCAFFNATYAASVNYTDGGQATSARIVDYGEPLRAEFDMLFSVPYSYINGTDLAPLPTYSATSLVGALTLYLLGNISLKLDTNLVSPMYTSVMNSIFVDNTGNSPSDISTSSLSLASPFYRNLGRLLEDACTNLTASLMSNTANLGQYTQVQATVTPDFNVYKYQASRLWLVYGIGLGVSLLADVYGLRCIAQNGGAMQRSFSSIAASVRDRELDALLNDTGEPLSTRADRVRLRYRAGGYTQGKPAGFAISGSSKGEEGEEMSETVALTDEMEARF
ncbi:unnamed protein product [Peniophora sp. CBMAI 1063]|nr:unnamed protein product [Peniophora sp. CBMAI 1063]